MNDPVGLAVSKPLAVDHGRPRDLTWSWMFRAVRSMERADEEEAEQGQVKEAGDGVKRKRRGFPSSRSERQASG
jgi:hypothetical protein